MSLGRTPVDFSSLSRSAAMERVARFHQAVLTHPDPPAPARHLLPLLNGLWNLDPTVLPDTWLD